MKKLKLAIPYTLVFILFGIILFLSPISGDDWGNYLVGREGIYHSIGNAIGMYFDWEGRFLSRVFINILTYHKVIWNLVNSLVIVSIVYLIVKILNSHNKKLIFFLSLFIIIFMNIYTFSQIIVWIAGNITYLFPIPLLLYYFYRILNNKDKTLVFTFLLIILNFIIPMFVEHVAGVLVIFNLIINIVYFIKYKKVNKKYLAYFIVSILGMAIMYFSPGNVKRSLIENLEFNELSIFGKIIYNIPNFIYYTFIINPYMILLMVVANIYLIKNIVSNKYIKVASYVYLTILPVVIIILCLVSNFIMQPFLTMFNQNNIFIIIYFISYILVEFILLIIFFYRKNKYIPFLFFILGIASNGIMLLSPTWGYRTSFLTYLLLSIAFISIIDCYGHEKKIINYILFAFTCIAFTFYLILYINLYRAQLDREKEIKRQIDNDIIYIEKFPSYVNCNINPDNPYHLGKFKEYYNIRQSTQIKLVEEKWKYIIFY